jgi:RimJ/RimL family protein N-acetyltransferase
MISLQTDRLIIRNFRPDDWQDLLEMVTQNQVSEFAQYDHPWPTEAVEVKGVAEWFASGDTFLAVTLKSTGKLIGYISMSRQEEQKGRVFGLGYVFNFRYHGQGYATEGCQAVIDSVFVELEADQVSTGTAAANLPSRDLLKWLGLKEVGRSRGSFWKMEDGTPIEFEAISYSLTRDEWLSKR